MPIITTSPLTIQDAKGRETIVEIDVSDDKEPIKMGRDVHKFCMTENVSTSSRILVNCPNDTGNPCLYI